MREVGNEVPEGARFLPGRLVFWPFQSGVPWVMVWEDGRAFLLGSAGVRSYFIPSHESGNILERHLG